MRRLIIPIIFLLSIQIAFAMYGGESEVIHSFPECLSLTINVNASLPIDDGEFSFLNCTKINQSYWGCDCSDNFDLILITKPNTVNSYSFDIIYYYQKEEAPASPSGGGGGSSGSGRGRTVLRKIVTKKVTPCVEDWECINWDECSAENVQTRKCNDLNNCGTLFYKPIEIKSCAYTLEKGLEEKEITTPTPKGLLEITGGAVVSFLKEKPMATSIIALVIVVGFGFYWFVFRRKKKKCTG